jgi:hypothetical protein
MMRNKSLLAVFKLALFISSLGLISGVSHSGERFISGFNDVPLMLGMTEAIESNVVFDTVQGRILVSFARSRESKDKIIAFYEESLSQLGWQMKEDGRFVRGVEILNVDFFPDGEYLVGRFSLEPR